MVSSSSLRIGQIFVGGRAEEEDGGKKQRMDSASSQPREAFYRLVVADSETALPQKAVPAVVPSSL